MSKKFRCGRQVRTLDGTMKEIGLSDGGGVRSCPWDRIDMTLDDAHDRARQIFELDGHQHRTFLCDFQRRPIDFNQFSTFSEYMNKYGLTGNKTTVYLCTSEGDDSVQSRTSRTNVRNSISKKRSWSSSTNEQRKFAEKKKTNSSRSSIGNRHLDGNQSASNKEYVERSTSEYSFVIAGNQLRENVQELIRQNPGDEILGHLLEYVCIIHGHGHSIIEPLKQQTQKSNQSLSKSEITLYSKSLTYVDQTCELTKTLLDINQERFRHVEIFLKITNSFAQFYQNFKTLQNQWLEKVQNGNTNSDRSSIPSSNVRSRIEGTSPNLNNQSLSHDHHEPNSDNSQESLQELPVSTFQSSFNKEKKDERTSLFQPLLDCLSHLLRLLSSKHSSSFRELVQSSIVKIESVRGSIDLGKEQSICDGKETMLYIKNEFIKKANELDHDQLNCSFDRQLNNSLKQILKGIRILTKNLDYHQIQISQNNRREGSTWSSPPPPFSQQGQSQSRYSI